VAELLMPKLNNNDEDYVLTAWLVKDGEPVAEGQPVAEVETSKASQELEAEAAGTFRPLVREGARCRPGEAIAKLVAEGEQPSAARAAASPTRPASSAAPAGPAGWGRRRGGGRPPARPAGRW
jgi:2-oxoglutarate dehydrogenase E2 component (dihydrolipoamide succinyltransferase)